LSERFAVNHAVNRALSFAWQAFIQSPTNLPDGVSGKCAASSDLHCIEMAPSPTRQNAMPTLAVARGIG
jgi:hypothetical protein